MFGFFKRNKKDENPKQPEKVTKVQLKPLDYQPKIVLAWAKAIEGNKEISKYLRDNGFPELVHAASAIWLSDTSREWLMKNGYAHLMAMINAAESNKKALRWLKLNNYELLYYMALAIDADNEGLAWIKANASPDIVILTQTIKNVKDRIEDNHNDVHKFGID